MAKRKKCIRCKREISAEKVCQECKNDLLYYYEATRDWQLAFEMESQQQYLRRYQKDTDINEFAH